MFHKLLSDYQFNDESKIAQYDEKIKKALELLAQKASNIEEAFEPYMEYLPLALQYVIKTSDFKNANDKKNISLHSESQKLVYDDAFIAICRYLRETIEKYDQCKELFMKDLSIQGRDFMEGAVNIQKKVNYYRNAPLYRAMNLIFSADHAKKLDPNNKFSASGKAFKDGRVVFKK